MSRVGTPTDNPVIESKNGWLKKEICVDYDINNYNTIHELIKDSNEYKPSYALNYKTLIEYRTHSDSIKNLLSYFHTKCFYFPSF